MQRRTYFKIFFILFVSLIVLFVYEYFTYFANDNGKYFTVVVLPDTQNYSSSYPEIFKSQTEWIANNIDKENIIFSVNVGDIVNNYNNELEWKNAKSAFSVLDGKVPYGLSLGNHDLSPQRSSEMFRKYFSFAEQKNNNWQGEDYPAGTGYNSYQKISVGNENLLFLNLSLCPEKDVIDWANKVISQFSERNVIISTHGFLNSRAERNIPVSKAQEGGCTQDGENTQYIWDGLIKNNKNVIMVLSGHVHAQAFRTDINNFGSKVFQILADYQSEPKGGNGWLRILKFNVKEKKVYVKTFSPYLNEFKSDSRNDFVLSY